MTTVVGVGAAIVGLAVLRRWLRSRGSAATGGRGPSRRAALLVVAALVGAQAVLGAPAFGQVPGLDDCKEPPNPERPGTGLVGALDPTPRDQGRQGSVYREYGYAGQVWHTYDLGCGPEGIRNPDAVIDTWTGNQLFNVGKAIVGASNGLHYALADQGLLAPLDDLIVSGTAALYDTVYAPWVGLIALLLAIVLFRSIWRGDLATVSRRTAWALAGIWFAAATFLTPLLYTNVLDEVLVDGSNQVRTGFLSEVGVEQRDALPTLLHEQIVYRNWLRGEFGSPDGPQARELGRPLVAAQAFSKQEIADGADDPDSGVTERKQREYEQIAERTGAASGYFRGVDGSRIGAGLLAALQSAMFALFQLLAQAALLLAQILLRVVILLGPVIGLIAILYHELLRGVGRAVGAALLNVIVLSALAALHTLVMVWVFDPARGLSVLAQMLLGGLITLVMLLVSRPVRRMWQMVELAVGAVGGALPAAPPGVLSRLRRRRGDEPASPSERFWAETRDAEEQEPQPQEGPRRNRPEGTVTATSERLDRDRPGAGAVLGPGQRPPGGSVPAGVLAGGNGSARALPAGGRDEGGGGQGASRLVDTSPVTEAAWDGNEEHDAVLVPSKTAPSSGNTPRRAEMEVVAGRPVWVLYRPSSGLVVDGRDGRNSHGRRSPG